MCISARTEEYTQEDVFPEGWHVVRKEGSNLYGIVDENNRQIADYKYYEIFEYEGECYGKSHTNDMVKYYKIED